MSYQLYAGGETPGKAEGYVSPENGKYTAVTSPEALPVRAWTHLALTCDGEELKLYLDGELADSAEECDVQASSGDLLIGGNEVFSEYLNGLIDEVRIYDRALSSEEIEEDMATAISTPPSLNPIAAYSFDEGEGSVANDVFGENHGAIEGATWVGGKYGTALHFEGEEEAAVTIPHSPELELSGSFTLEAWVRPDHSQYWTPVLAKQTDDFFGYALYANGETQGTPEGYVAQQDWEFSEAKAEEVEPRAWTHLAMTCDGETLRLYVDGELADTGSRCSAQSSEGVLQIGANEVFNEWFNGTIDEVRIYNRALGVEEIEADRDTALDTPPFESPIAAYSFDEGEGETVYDSFGENDGTVDGAEWVTGKFGKALSFDREAEDSVEIPASLDLDLSDDFTLSAWVKPEEHEYWMPVLARETSAYHAYALYAAGEAPSKPQGMVAERDWEPSEVLSEEALSINQWAHLALTSDGENLKLYVDGELIDTAPASSAQHSEGALRIGGHEAWGYYFDGLIDEVRVYERALELEQIEMSGEYGVIEGFPAQFIHDADGRLKAMIRAHGGTAVYHWDPAGNLLSISRHSSAKLSIVQLNPGKAGIGDSISIEGTGFATIPGSNTVKFNGTAATVTAATATKLTVEVPEGVTSGPVTVATPGEGPVSSPSNFEVVSSQAPHIASLSPTLVETGDEVTVSGSNFAIGAFDNSVQFNQSRPALEAASSTTLKFKAPAATLGGRVSVTTPNGIDHGIDLYVAPSSIPKGKVEDTGRLSFGAPASIELKTPDRVGLALFDGQAGQKVTFALSENTIGNPSAVVLWDPTGAYVVGAEGGITNPITLPSSGTYTVTVDPNYEATGSVKLSAYLVEDVTGSITPTKEGAKKSVTITTPGQNALYSVEVEAGEAVSVKTSNASFNSENIYWVQWLNSKGESLDITPWVGKTGSGFWKQYTFPSAGTYTLKVDPTNAMTGSVDLTLWDSTNKSGTITPSSEGESKTFSVDVPGQRNVITFSGTEGQEISLAPSEATFGGEFEIIRPNGGELSGSYGSLSSIHGPFTLPETGTYKIPLRGYSEATGSVKLSAYLESSIALISPIENDARLVSLRIPIARVAEVTSDIPGGTEKQVNPRRQEASIGLDQGKPALMVPRPDRPRQAPPTEVDGPIQSKIEAFRPGKHGTWRPSRSSGGGELWVVGGSRSPWQAMAPLRGADGQTAVAGQALKLNGLPVAGLRVSIKGTAAAASTDRAGRFLLSGDIPSGPHVLALEGESVSGEERFGNYEVRVELEPNVTTQLDYTIWLNPLDKAGDLRIESPTEGEASLKTPSVPGLEVRIPAGTVIRDDRGRAIRDLNMTPIPVDRPPFPLPPFVAVPVYFTVQPGGAYLSKGAQFVYPNWGDLAPGERVDFWNYDPTDRGWYVYGRGTVTPDGKQVMPDPDVRVWEFSGAMATSGATPPGTYPRKAYDGDPVDLYSGLFTYQKTDLSLPDTIPLSIQRTYRPNDTNSYDFGIGMTSIYDLRLWAPSNSEALLVLPDGGRVRYIRTSPGEGPLGTEYEAKGSPGPFYGSEITWNAWSNCWELDLTNGFTLTFAPFGAAPLISIRDRHGNTLLIKRAGGFAQYLSEVVTPNGRWAKFTYDSEDRVTKIVDNGGRVVKYSYASGRLAKVEAPGGRNTEYEYDGSGRMKAVINARGNKYLQNVYDGNGRVEKQTMGDGGTFEFSYDLDEEGQVESTTVTDPVGVERKVDFDSDGLVVSDTQALGSEVEATTSYERQAETELLLSVTDPLERKTELEYDGFGNVTEVTQLAGTEDVVTSKFEYEPGTTNVTKITDPLGHASQLEYGPKGELLKRIDPLENETTFEYDEDGQLVSILNPEEEETEFSYNYGDLLSVTDPLGRTTSQFVDALGRVRSVTSPSGRRAYFEYNEADDLTRILSPSGAETAVEYDKDGDVVSITDPRENETTATYDAMDRIESETDPLEETAEWDYDKAGRPIEAIDRNGDIAKFDYDQLGRLASARFGVEGEAEESRIEYEYDAGNRLIEVADSASGAYVLDYDDLDRLISIEGPTDVVGYEYDEAGRRTQMAASGLGVVDYEYDDANRLSEVSDGSQTVSLGYDDADRLSSFVLPNGIEQVYEYDGAGQTTSISYMDGEDPLGEIEYAFDADGRTKSIAGSLGRMILPEALGLAEYNAANELVKRGGDEYKYDANGSLLDDGANEYEWDTRGQLTGISGAASASFGYDPFGRRTSKTLGEASTEVAFDGPNAILESSGEEVTASMLTGLEIDQLFSRTTGEGTQSYLTNSLGSVVALANGSKEMQTTYAYDPFGSAASFGAASDNSHQFTGRENDGTSLQFNRARYYSPGDARFISRDPAGFEASGPNLYNYVDGAPLNFTDPTGEEWGITFPNPAGIVEDAISDAVSEAGDKIWEHRREIGTLGVGVTCAVSGGTTCLIVAGSGAGAAALDAAVSNQCGSDLVPAVTAAGTTIVGALPGLPLVGLEAAGKISIGLSVPERLGLAAPGELLSLGGGSVIEKGANERYAGGSEATSSC